MEDDSSVPVKDGPFAYSWKYIEGGEHPIRIRTPREGGEEEVLLDINEEAKNKEYFEIGFVDEDPTHSILAWSRDTSGAEYYSLTFRDLDTGKDRDVEINDVGSATWANATTLFYSRVDENHRPSKIFRHSLGSDPKNDVLVYEETDTRFYCGVGKTRSDKYIILSAGMNDQDELRIIPTDNVEAEPILIQKRQDGLEYSLEHQNDRFLIQTNADGAVDFKIVETPVDHPSMENWKDFIPHKEGRMIISFSAYKDWIIWMERENALPRICFMGKDGKTNEISMDEEAYALGVSPSPEFDTNIFRYNYSSPTTPS